MIKKIYSHDQYYPYSLELYNLIQSNLLVLINADGNIKRYTFLKTDYTIDWLLVIIHFYEINIYYIYIKCIIIITRIVFHF